MDEASGGKPVPPERQATIPTCQVCGEPLPDRAVVECRKCHTLHHLECWRFNKGCAMYACGCRSSVKPAGGDELARRGSFEIESFSLEGGVKPLVGLMFLLMIALGAGAALNSVPAVLAPLLGSLGVWMYLVIRHGLARDLLRVDAESGTIGRTVQAFGRRLKSQDRWLTAGDIVELHVHRTPPQGATGILEWKIYALLRDGRRKLVYRNHAPVVDRKRDDDVAALAERLAVFADCTVREFEGKNGPSEAEIQEALVQRQQDRAAAARALPAATAPADPARAVPASPLPERPASSPDPPPEERNRSRVSG